MTLVQGKQIVGLDANAVRDFLSAHDLTGIPLTFYMWESPAGTECALFWRDNNGDKYRRDYMLQEGIPRQYGGNKRANQAVEEEGTQ